LRLAVSSAYLRGCGRHCGARQARARDTQRKNSGKDNSSADAHDSSTADPQVNGPVLGPQRPTTAHPRHAKVFPLWAISIPISALLLKLKHLTVIAGWVDA
jgi:hypothetical protein